MTTAAVKPQPVVVKVCGVTRSTDIVECAQLGVDWIGINLWPQSQRGVDTNQARRLLSQAKELCHTTVAVLVDAGETQWEDVSAWPEVDMIQFYGPPPAGPMFKPLIACFPLSDDADALAITQVSYGLLDVEPGDDPGAGKGSWILVDSKTPGHGGSGIRADWALAQSLAQTRRLILAGGLTAHNVGQAAAQVMPRVVDVASGVESAPGKKDSAKIREFVAAAKGIAL